jgi:prevent-host-death family protein
MFLHWERFVTITTLTSREFNQDTGRAKKAARKGPVFITDRGRPAHVLLTIDEYQRLAGGRVSLAEALAMPGGEDIEFDPPKADIRLRIPDLS